jgi:cold shock CspA family protein/ribosome-associated translation inhibitor RaiA
MPFQKDPIVAFHNMDASPALEAEILERCRKLEQRFAGVIGIRVAVEARHRQHRTGNVHEVHIELALPGRDVVVSKEPKRTQEKYARPNVRTSIRDAFKAAERQLDDMKDLIRGDVKPPEATLPGRIAELVDRSDYGFIETAAGARLFFAAGAVQGGERFEDLRTGDPVHFVEAEGEAGPAAMRVWRAGRGTPTRD